MPKIKELLKRPIEIQKELIRVRPWQQLTLLLFILCLPTYVVTRNSSVYACKVAGVLSLTAMAALPGAVMADAFLNPIQEEESKLLTSK